MCVGNGGPGHGRCTGSSVQRATNSSGQQKMLGLRCYLGDAVITDPSQDAIGLLLHALNRTNKTCVARGIATANKRHTCSSTVTPSNCFSSDRTHKSIQVEDQGPQGPRPFKCGHQQSRAARHLPPPAPSPLGAWPLVHSPLPDMCDKGPPLAAASRMATHPARCVCCSSSSSCR